MMMVMMRRERQTKLQIEAAFFGIKDFRFQTAKSDSVGFCCSHKKQLTTSHQTRSFVIRFVEFG